MTLKVGDKAPNFTLRDTEKAEVSLSEYRGKNVLVLFFPLAFTGVCTDELCSIRDEKAEYDALNVDILAISVDSLFTLTFHSFQILIKRLLGPMVPYTRISY